jgi:hypothetical protein
MKNRRKLQRKFKCPEVRANEALTSSEGSLSVDDPIVMSFDWPNLECTGIRLSSHSFFQEKNRAARIRLTYSSSEHYCCILHHFHCMVSVWHE